MSSYKMGNATFEVEIKDAEGGRSLYVDGREALPDVSVEHVAGKEVAVRAGDMVFRAHVHREGNEFYCHVGGETYRISAQDTPVGCVSKP